MEKITREEINRRLELLRKSKSDDESYKKSKDRRPSAMCYMVAMPNYPEKFKCNICGKDEYWDIKDDFFATIIGFSPDVELKVRMLQNAGLVATYVYHCRKCVKKHKKSMFEIWVKAVDDDEWNITIPAGSYGLRDKDTEPVTDEEYLLTSIFLTATDQTQNLAKAFDHLYNEVYRLMALEEFVGKELFESIDVDYETDNHWKKKEKKKIIHNDPKLFYSGIAPLDFYSVKDLSISKALSMIKEQLEQMECNRECRGMYWEFYQDVFCDFHYLTYVGIYPRDESTRMFGIPKAEVDGALKKVLNINFEYDYDELRKMIEAQLKFENHINDGTLEGKDPLLPHDSIIYSDSFYWENDRKELPKKVIEELNNLDKNKKYSYDDFERLMERFNNMK